MKKVWADWDKCMGCKSCELQCAIERDSVSKTLIGAVREDPKPVARLAVVGNTGECFPIQCRHCQDAPCIRACPSGAMQRDENQDAVIIDQSRCRGCWMCVMSCPFGAIIPAHACKVAVKCDACFQMEEPACVNACPTGALIYCDEANFQKVTLKKKKDLAVFACQRLRSGAVSLELAREDGIL